MSKLKYVIIATLLAISAGWALRAQTSQPPTLTAADFAVVTVKVSTPHSDDVTLTQICLKTTMARGE